MEVLIVKTVDSIVWHYPIFSRCHSRIVPSKCTLAPPHFPQCCCAMPESDGYSFVYKYYGSPRNSGILKIFCQQIKHKAEAMKSL